MPAMYRLKCMIMETVSRKINCRLFSISSIRRTGLLPGQASACLLSAVSQNCTAEMCTSAAGLMKEVFLQCASLSGIQTKLLKSLLILPQVILSNMRIPTQGTDLQVKTYLKNWNVLMTVSRQFLSLMTMKTSGLTSESC